MRCQLLFSAALLALFICTSVSATHKKKELTHYPDDCRLGFHSLNVTTDDDCTGSIPVLSCHGLCQSYFIPRFFESKTLTDDTEFDKMSKCCTATKRKLRSVLVTVTCPDGTTKEISHFASTATECACTL